KRIEGRSNRNPYHPDSACPSLCNWYMVTKGAIIRHENVQVGVVDDRRRRAEAAGSNYIISRHITVRRPCDWTELIFKIMRGTFFGLIILGPYRTEDAMKGIPSVMIWITTRVRIGIVAINFNSGIYGI